MRRRSRSFAFFSFVPFLAGKPNGFDGAKLVPAPRLVQLMRRTQSDNAGRIENAAVAMAEVAMTMEAAAAAMKKA
jgi:hypothetical protein